MTTVILIAIVTSLLIGVLAGITIERYDSRITNASKKQFEQKYKNAQNEIRELNRTKKINEQKLADYLEEIRELNKDQVFLEKENQALKESAKQVIEAQTKTLKSELKATKESVTRHLTKAETDKERIEKLEQEKESLERQLKAEHFLNRYRNDNLEKILDNFLKDAQYAGSLLETKISDIPPKELHKYISGGKKEVAKEQLQQLGFSEEEIQNYFRFIEYQENL